MESVTMTYPREKGKLYPLLEEQLLALTQGVPHRMANLANASTMTDYDEAMNKLWDDNVTQPYIKGEVDLDTAIANFKAAVSAQFEGIVVE